VAIHMEDEVNQDSDKFHGRGLWRQRMTVEFGCWLAGAESNSGPWRCPAFAKKRWADLLFAGRIQRLIFHLRTSASSADKVSWRLDRSAVVQVPPSKNTSADDA
ncbi:hypothetical protein ACVBEH_25790, partial [Roseateles sp. GG27B]